MQPGLRRDLVYPGSITYRAECTTSRPTQALRTAKDEPRSRGSPSVRGAQELRATGRTRQQTATEGEGRSRRTAGVVAGAAAGIAAGAMTDEGAQGVAAGVAGDVRAAGYGAVGAAGEAAVAGESEGAGSPQAEEIGVEPEEAAGDGSGDEGGPDGPKAQRPAPPYTARPQIDATCVVGRGGVQAGWDVDVYCRRGCVVVAGFRRPPLLNACASWYSELALATLFFLLGSVDSHLTRCGTDVRASRYGAAACGVGWKRVKRVRVREQRRE